MNSEISKIQIRQDTAENWRTVNPILAIGEPAYELPSDLYPYGAFKIGDGERSWLDLEYQTKAGESIQDIQEPNGKMYCRRWMPDALKPTWESFELPKEDTRKSFADLMASPYNEEINMNYYMLDADGLTRIPVYAIKKRYSINKQSGLTDTQTINIGSKIKNILQIGGIYQKDEDHIIALPCSTSRYYVEVSVDKETDNQIININSYSSSDRTDAILDIFIIYAKEVNA